jgi:hypothetical protein
MMANARVSGLPAAALVAAALMLAACQTRSISDAGYAGAGGRNNPFYRGELTEFDLLGIDPARPASDGDIAALLGQRHSVAPRRGGTVMVIQSGALIPDPAMLRALDPYVTVVPFSGVPLGAAGSAASGYARALRLAAAEAGAETILCYWGILESAVEREPTKVVSWLPILGQAIPDEAQLMRIRLKLALVDVRTGSWTMLAPPPFVDDALSASLTRAASDQRQVERLKEQAYKAAVAALAARLAS